MARSWTGPAELQADGDLLWWLEQRPAEDGRQVVCRRGSDGGCITVTPPGFSARTRMHEYGGGAYLAHNGTVWFSNFADQRLYRQIPGGEPEPVSRQPAAPGEVRYADACVTPDGAWLICVRERHDSDHSRNVVNDLIAIPASGDIPAAPRVLASGRDFYAAPRLSPDGRHLAWLEWDHPNMPWDGTDLWVADLSTSGKTAEAGLALAAARLVAGGPGESVCQPAWDPSGSLHFISDRSGWWNLCRIPPGCSVGGQGEAEPLAPLAAEFTIPQWWFGLSSYAFLPDGRIACAYWKGAIGHTGLVVPGTGKVDPLVEKLFVQPLQQFARVRRQGRLRGWRAGHATRGCFD